MQQVDREAEWLVAVGVEEDGMDELPAVIEHWLLEDFSDIVPQSADLGRSTA